MKIFFCYAREDEPLLKELKQAMERHDRGEAVVIPIILRPVYFQDAPFSKLQVLPTDAKPVKSWLDQDEAFFNVAEGIRREVERLSRKPIVNPEVSNSVNPKVPTSKSPIAATDRVVVVPARIALYLSAKSYIPTL